MSHLQLVSIPGYRCRVVSTRDSSGIAPALSVIEAETLWDDAAMTAFDVLRNEYGRVAPGFEWRMEVLDPTGQVIFQFTFKAEAVIPQTESGQRTNISD